MKVSCTRLAVLLLAGLFRSCTAQFQYTFIVFNDIKGQLQEYDRGSEIDKPFPCSGQTCRGGLRKIVEQIDVLRNSSLNKESTFVLTSGNLVGGESGWLPMLGWRKYGELIKYHYKPNATSLGMNDFGAGLIRTLVYMNEAETPVVLHNVDCNDVSGLERAFCSHSLIFTQTVYHLADQLGLVGFINPDVMKLSSPGGLKFKEVIPALQSVIANNSIQYETYIAIGDGSLELARDILAQVPQIRLVIYGQSFGSSKNMIGDFPEVSGNGFIATAGNYGSSVGKLVAEIGPTGLIVDTTGSDLFPTDLVASPGNASNMYTRFQQEVNQATNIVASSQLELVGGEVCWREECNLGNLITDAMVHCVLGQGHDGNVPLPNQEPIFSLWHSGAFFMDSIRANTIITNLDIHKWLPYHNRVYFVRIQGSNLLEVFKKSATGINAHLNGTEKDWGQFLQVSNGMQVVYSTPKGNHPEVVQIKLRHGLVMEELDPLRIYYFVIPSFIYEGRNLYDFAKPYWDVLLDIDFDDSCVTKYAQAMKRLAVGVGERIFIDRVDFNFTTTTTIDDIDKTTPVTGRSVATTATGNLTAAIALINLVLGVRKIF